MGTILAQVPSTPNYVLGSRASHPAMASEHFDEEIEEEEPVVDQVICATCERVMSPLDAVVAIVCDECQRSEAMAERQRSEVMARARERTAERQRQADERQQRRAVGCAAASGTSVSLAENFRNLSTGIKYEAGISGVIVHAQVIDDKRCVKFDDVSFLVPACLLQCNTDGSADKGTDGGARSDATPATELAETPAIELAEEPTPTWGHPFGAGKAGRGLSV